MSIKHNTIISTVYQQLYQHLARQKRKRRMIYSIITSKYTLVNHGKKKKRKECITIIVCIAI